MTGRRFALVRHPTPAVAAGVCYGRLDVGLAAGAEAELATTLRALDGFAASWLWTSPAVRCRAAAEAIASAMGLAAKPDARLLELDFGEWEGRKWDDVPRDALDRWAASPQDFAAPGGESGGELAARVGSFAAMLEHQAGDAVVVSHGGPLKILSALLGGRAVNLLAAPLPIGSVEIVTVPEWPPRR